MSSKYPHSKYPFIRFYIGDIRDSERILSASEGIENIIHAAALKQVPSTEYNPFEAVQTNIIGSQNVIKAAISNNVKRVVALSTDNAHPLTFMVQQNFAQINFLYLQII